MTSRPKILSEDFVRDVATEGRYGDGRGGNGLSLLVKKMRNGRLSKSWSQRVSLNGKPTRKGLGSYPKVTLDGARRRAVENAQALAEGHNPWKRVPTFAEMADRLVTMNSKSWRSHRTEAIWRNTLETYAVSKIGKTKIDRIGVNDVVACLEPIWMDKQQTAKKLRVMMSNVFKLAVANGYRYDDPAQSVAALLPRQTSRVRHHAAVQHSMIGDVVKTIRHCDGPATAKLCLEWVIHTACRSGEARSARWSEIDWSGKIWTIPADRNKTGQELRVPLTTSCIQLLDRARPLAGGSELIFPSIRGKVMTDSRLSALLRDNDIDGTVHGFRSSFRDWCGEAGQPREIAELCLGHSFGNAVEQAYARSDLLARRRQVMEKWSKHVETQRR